MPTETILGTAYPTVILPDGREWMAKNLYVDAYGGRFYQDNGTLYPANVFGRLYPYDRHPEVTSALTGTAWRIPDNEDWLGLIDACGIGDLPNTQYNGSALRSIGHLSDGFVVWGSTNGGTDLHGFKALGSGRFDGASPGGGFKETTSVAYFASGSAPYPYDPSVPTRRRYPQFLVTQGTGAVDSPRCIMHVAPTSAGLAATGLCCVSIRLVRDLGFDGIYPKKDGVWRHASDAHVAHGGAWRKASRVFVADAGAWRGIL